MAGHFSRRQHALSFERLRLKPFSAEPNRLGYKIRLTYMRRLAAHTVSCTRQALTLHFAPGTRQKRHAMALLQPQTTDDVV